jgi:hypothetical protein
MKVAVYAIARNEAAHVARWAQSAAEADYRVVADAGSSDDTAERLAAAGVTVHRIAIRPWRFDDARNAALAHIPEDVDVCCVMDMGMWLEPGWRPQLEAAWQAETTALSCQMALRESAEAPSYSEHPWKSFHRRWGYRFRRPVHEELCFAGEEVHRHCRAIRMNHLRRRAADQGRHLGLMELAYREDPNDPGTSFWLARELMAAHETGRAAEMFERYLAMPGAASHDERSEAMRCLARVVPERRMEWLERARAEAPHRREIWHDLAEELHSRADWPNLFWACANGIEKTRSTGSSLDDPHAWGYRLYDLGAIACWHLNLMDRAVEWGKEALQREQGPERQRLRNNLDFFIGRRAELRQGS